MAENKKLITVAQAAEILGRSKPTIYAALNSHPPRLHYHDPVKRLLLRDGIEERFSRSTRPRIDHPQVKPSEPISVASDDWNAIAAQCNQLIDFELWGPGPWSPDRWAGLAGVIEHATREVQSSKHRGDNLFKGTKHRKLHGGNHYFQE